jgi:hypothetical protein
MDRSAAPAHLVKRTHPPSTVPRSPLRYITPGPTLSRRPGPGPATPSRTERQTAGEKQRPKPRRASRIDEATAVVRAVGLGLRLSCPLVFRCCVRLHLTTPLGGLACLSTHPHPLLLSRRYRSAGLSDPHRSSRRSRYYCPSPSNQSLPLCRRVGSGVPLVFCWVHLEGAE